MSSVGATRTARTCLAVIVGATLAACGAKTGLIVPDVESGVDAAVDVPVDVPTDVPRRTICVPPPGDSGIPLVVDLDVRPVLAVADVLFIIDRTGSMTDEIANVRNGLRTIIVPGLLRAIPDLHLGLVTFGEFPVFPYGEDGDRPFTLERPLDNQYDALQGAIENITAGGGGDNPEAQVEALAEIATGAGLPPYIPASGGCPVLGTGYPCFRPNAQPVIIMVTDAPFHNGATGPGGAESNPYDPERFAPYPAPHTYPQMLTLLNASIRPRFLGINAGGDGPDTGRADMVLLARDTSTIGSNGQPLIFDIQPDGQLSQQIVSAVEQFTTQVPFDVSARALSLDNRGGARFITAIRPERAVPMGNIASLDDTTFHTVIPGTQLFFGLVIDPTLITQTSQEQQFPVRVQFYRDGRPSLGYTDIVLVIPPLGTTTCN